MILPKPIPNGVTRTKIIPPPRNARMLARPRVSNLLKQAFLYRLTILQAGAGYGKSTALTELAAEVPLLTWYQVNQEDNDPLVFLLHLCHAFQQASIPNLPIGFLESWDGSQGRLPWRGVLDQLLNGLINSLTSPALLVLDDAHLVTESGEVPHIIDRLVGLAPTNLHILLSGRPPMQLPTLSRWRAKGDVLMLDQSILTFNAQEISSLFTQRFSFELSNEEVEALLAYSEGWAVALQLIWQHLRSTMQGARTTPHPAASNGLSFPVNWQVDSLDVLFEILAREVFQQQPEDVRDFLLITATLRDLHPEVCDALRSQYIQSRADFERISLPAPQDSAAMLAYLRRQELFVVETATGELRYHHIFHNFLRQQSSPEQRNQWHRLASDYHLAKGDRESALYHLIEARLWDDVANLLDEYALNLLGAGRLDTLAVYLDALPPHTLHQHPMLVFTLGELARLHSRFDEALGWYQQSATTWRARGQKDGVARALRGQARVYLDTVNPSKAEQLLEEAIRMSDGFEDREAQVRLFELLAENKLNAGRVADAERLRQQAEDLRSESPSNDQLLYRVLLRTGRLDEACRGLEALAQAERQQPVQTPRAHRETMLILSLIYAFQGRSEQAYEAAIAGTRRGDDLKSPFVSAVGHMRQGHALMISRPQPTTGQLSMTGHNQDFNQAHLQARQQFEQSIALSRLLEVPRLLVEAYWGLCRSHGYLGDLLKAQGYAQEAIEIATQAGDEWIASMVRLTMGASLNLCARFEAAEQWLNRAVLGFQECSDRFGSTAARLWLCLGWFKNKQHPRLKQALPEVLNSCRENGYGFLFTRPSLVGASDERIFIPLLLFARQNLTGEDHWIHAYLDQILVQAGVPGIELHPGYQIRVQTLGAFQVWRGQEPIPATGWRREKSRQLFQLLLTYRTAPLDRDQISEYLWPEAEPSLAQRNFKTALNTLYQVLEPEREPGSESAFILREGTTYALRPGCDLWLDAAVFSDTIHGAYHNNTPLRGKPDLNLLQQAVQLYQGEYLPETLYETWAAEERERLASLFLETADHLAEALLAQAEYDQVINLCQRILAQDNCWERAYRHLMQAYDRLGDHGQVGRTYQRCVQSLRNELDVAPSSETQALYQTLIDRQQSL